MMSVKYRDWKDFVKWVLRLQLNGANSANDLHPHHPPKSKQINYLGYFNFNIQKNTGEYPVRQLITHKHL